MPRDAIEYLLSMPQYANTTDAATPGLERMEALMDAMDRPHEALRAVHVAGTNGKGSVCSMIASIATAAGLRTGLHTSPHLTHITQRMRIDGVPAPTDWLADTIDAHRPAIDRIEPSFFELTVALTFRYFAEQDVDLAVIEVGLGGRLDGTNVLRPALSVITNIDLDHTDILGDTLDAIAREKAGILKPDTPALSAVAQDEARTAIAAVADEVGADLHELRDEVTWNARRADLTGSVLDVETPLRRYDGLRVSLAGPHQQGNAALALRAAELVLPFLKNNPQPAYDGLGDVQSRTGFRGRLEVLRDDPLVIVDVAHNPPGIRATLDTVLPEVAERGGTLHVCLNAVRGKGLDETARMLADCGAVVTPIPIDTKRALPPDEIAQRLRAQGVSVQDPQPLADALDTFVRTAASEDVLLLIGSHKLVEVLPVGWA